MIFENVWMSWISFLLLQTSPFILYFSPCWPTVGALMLSWTILINIEHLYTQIKSECCWPLRLLQAHLSVAVRLHQFDEWCVPLDLELDDWSILTRNLQVYVFVAFRLDRFLSGKKKKIRGGKMVNSLPGNWFYLIFKELTFACSPHPPPVALYWRLAVHLHTTMFRKPFQKGWCLCEKRNNCKIPYLVN